MELSNLVKKELIFPQLQYTNRDEIYHFMLSEMKKVFPTIDSTSCINGLNEREKLGSIVYANGIAIPHARIESCNCLAISIANFAKPVRFGEDEVSLVVMIITDPSQSALYLKTVAAFAKLASRIEHIYQKIASSKKRDEIHSLINMAHLDLESDLLARDIMMQAITISNEAYVQEVTDTMKMNHVGFLPVVDSNQKYVGEVNNLDIIKLSLPEYVFMMEDLSFLLTLEPFKEFLKQEKNIPISRLVKPHKTIEPNTPMVEVVFVMLKYNMNHITVAEKSGKVVGVITTKDIVEKILRV